MRKLHAAVAAVFMLGAAGMFAAQLDDDTANFIKNTARDGKHEVAMGKMAAEKATNADVKKFGQMLVDDHTKANQELMDLAQKLNVDLSGIDPMELHKQHADQFDKATGAAFDRAFMGWAVEDHNKAVDSFQNYIKSGKNSDVVAFAGRWLPGLKQHQQMARDLNDRISKGAMGDQNFDNQPVASREQSTQTTATSQERQDYLSENAAPIASGNQSVSVREQNFEQRTNNAAPVVRDENVSIRERNYVQQPVAERREFRASRVQEPVSDRGTFVSYDNSGYASECSSCEHKTCHTCSHSDCDTCNPCGFEGFMYDNDWRDGITHEIHSHESSDCD